MKENNNCFLAFWLRSSVNKNKGNVFLAFKFVDIWQSVRHLKKIKIVFQFLTIRFCPGPQIMSVKLLLLAFSKLVPYRYTQNQDISRGSQSFKFLPLKIWRSPSLLDSFRLKCLFCFCFTVSPGSSGWPETDRRISLALKPQRSICLWLTRIKGLNYHAQLKLKLYKQPNLKTVCVLGGGPRF